MGSRSLRTHALSNSCSLPVFPMASGFDNGSRSANRLNQVVRSEAALAGSGERRGKKFQHTRLPNAACGRDQADLEMGGRSDQSRDTVFKSREFHVPGLAGWLHF